MAAKSVLAAAVLCALVATASCYCTGSSSKYNWVYNTYTSSCNSEFKFSVSSGSSNGTLITAVEVSGPYAITLEIGSASNSTAGTGTAQLCTEVDMYQNVTVYAYLNTTVSSGGNGTVASVPFYFYYSVNYTCGEVPTGPVQTPQVFNVISVSCNGDLSATALEPREYGLISLTSQAATAFPAESFLFTCGTRTLLFERALYDSQYVTSQGVCAYESVCASNDGSFTYSVTTLSSPRGEVAVTAPREAAVNQSFIIFPNTRQFATTSQLDAITGYDGFGFPMSQLTDFISYYPPAGQARATVASYQPFINDEEEEAIVTFNIKREKGNLDFYAYVECDEDDDIFECSGFEATGFFPSLYPVPDFKENTSWDEQQPFQLFDIL